VLFDKKNEGGDVANIKINPIHVTSTKEDLLLVVCSCSPISISPPMTHTQHSTVEGGVVKEEWTINFDDLEFGEVCMLFMMTPPPPKQTDARDRIGLFDDHKSRNPPSPNSQEIGSGAFGTVFKGDYYGTVVAIKRLNASNNLQQEHLNKYIQREVALLKYVRQPGGGARTGLMGGGRAGASTIQTSSSSWAFASMTREPTS